MRMLAQETRVTANQMGFQEYGQPPMQCKFREAQK